MVNTAVIGMQWGDEGKGKVVDELLGSSDFKLVVRYQGGANAGHTVIHDGEEYKLHLIPSGITRKGVTNVIAHGAFDVRTFFREVRELQDRGVEVNPSNLVVSNLCPLDLFYHKKLDLVTGGKIGTTARGIGPTYVDQVRRTGLRVEDLFDEASLIEKIGERVDFINHEISYHDPSSIISPDELLREIDEMKDAREGVLDHIRREVPELIAKHDGECLFEGAQGTFLDNVYGTFPGVTSSRTLRGEISNGCGRFMEVPRVVGILKAYTTRVGNGPFPTEQDNDYGNKLRDRGREYGTTTGRARRCGWLDLILAKEAVSLNGITEIALTKLDVLDEFGLIQVGVGYTIDGEEVNYFPRTELEKVTPTYQGEVGWVEGISDVRERHHLPSKAKEYVRNIEMTLGVPIRSIGVGPDREQTIKVAA